MEIKKGNKCDVPSYRLIDNSPYKLEPRTSLIIMDDLTDDKPVDLNKIREWHNTIEGINKNANN